MVIDSDSATVLGGHLLRRASGAALPVIRIGDALHVDAVGAELLEAVNRPVQGTYLPSLVFPELVEGRYELYRKGTDDVRLTAEVRGGEVTAATWPQ